jgi:hypothetical protein
MCEKANGAGAPGGGHQKEHVMKPDPARPKNEPHRLAQHDQPYAWGRPPSTYLPFCAIIRLAILRSKLESIRSERHTWLGSTNERAA